MGYIFRLRNADEDGKIVIESQSEEYPSDEAIEDVLQHFQIDDYNPNDFKQDIFNLFDVRSNIKDCDYVVSIYKDNQSDPYEGPAKKCQRAREKLQRFVVRPGEHVPQKKTDKQKVLEEAATELTLEGCLSIYPDDIEDLYEDGMNAEDIIKRFNKRSACCTKEESNMSVYAISGFNNSNYDGIFTLLFNSEEKMMAEVEDMIASDMGMSRAAFIRLRREDKAEFDSRFTDSGDRTYEKCLEDGAYYCSNGYELSWGECEVR